jgi:monoamine oxidase
MYQAMAAMGQTQESHWTGPLKLDGDPHGASVVILGAGLAGMTAAYELKKAGYKVTVLEYQDRTGGRNWTLRGGDTIREIGSTQKCEFDSGLYLNPGPWRIPYHHHAIINYCREFGVALEPFHQINNNAFVHNTEAFGGKPKRYREVENDFHGHVAELLARATNQSALDQTVSKEDREILLEALKNWGALDSKYRYAKSELVSERRGYDVLVGAGSTAPVFSQPIEMHDLLQSQLWKSLAGSHSFDMQPSIFQPVGGMGKIGDAFAREIGPGVIKMNCRVVKIDQDNDGVTVSYVDPLKGGPTQTITAQWCINTIPAPVLSRLPMQISGKMQAAIDAVAPYSTNFKAGLQMKRRFWEEDDLIFGGFSNTNLSIRQIGYPNSGYATRGKGVLLGAYIGGANCYEYAAMDPKDRLKRILAEGAQIHPQYKDEFENGVTVAWHRIPWTMGCLSAWTEERRKDHYEDLIAMDGRMMLAGEHASYGIWQEHAILSALDAVKRLHKRIVAA